MKLKWSLLPRYSVFGLCVLGLLVCLGLSELTPWIWPLTLLMAFLVAVGIYDMQQPDYAVRRNYPVIGNMRYLFKALRPEMRQYLFESDTDQLPFSHKQRELVYARGRQHNSSQPFGTLLDVYSDSYEFIGHSMQTSSVPDPKGFRLNVGNSQCSHPYNASLFNISAMSFGSLSANAIRALNKGARLGNFAHDTGEGSISPYHREFEGDLIWELGSGYFGCRDEEGRFDGEKFARQAASEQVKMIEIKLSQGAKPGHGGVLPASKISEEIAETRGIPMGKDCISPSNHGEFSTPLELLSFIQRLRELSGGKPVGFKLCLGQPWEFMAIVKAMLETGIVPDFIVVDGSEGGTGAAPTEFTDHLGTPLREGLQFVHNSLVGAGLRDEVRIGVSGKIISAFDIACVMALGADWVNAARGYMFALGCIQSLSCHTNKCPTGIATQDDLRQKSLVVEDKADQVRHFHHNTLHALAEILSAAGLHTPWQITPDHLVHRVSENEVKLFSHLHPFLTKGALLTQGDDYPFYRRVWAMAQAESFQPRSLSEVSGAKRE
ncbi:FMN-binding glutamate synthase family protein [Cobetia amphilecti]|uniref:FMN-binding glutamate synthase family protein n=2 Tax=Cobetia TaxID=204286 RepID=A0ABT6UTW3_9GAMM|nr:FMN-binding glutamate synthase family protein [Cobetia amphilecti]MDI5885493.1 FMN-binding glutamate synthase family protein [Cobetia amphilecti]WOI25677.1 FMN-binding glutamate synthase family protein [Cobetia amphilecti]